jgi:hypothetical protein
LDPERPVCFFPGFSWTALPNFEDNYDILSILLLVLETFLPKDKPKTTRKRDSGSVPFSKQGNQFLMKRFEWCYLYVFCWNNLSNIQKPIRRRFFKSLTVSHGNLVTTKIVI